MNSKFSLLARSSALGCALLLAQQAAAFVHISQLKPRLNVDPEHPDIVFHWNGESPKLKEKGKVLDGVYADASDRDLMEALLQEAVRTWNDVPTSYLEFVVVEDPNAVLDTDDETFSIVVAEQASKAVAAAALPNFLSQDPNPSDLEKNPHIIHDCDISVSDSSVDAKSLLKTLVHELGHCLGLGHPHANYKSIMSYASTSDGSALMLDDEAGISFLYPEPGESQKVESMTCGRLGGQLAVRSSLAGSLVLVLPPVLLLSFGAGRQRRPLARRQRPPRG